MDCEQRKQKWNNEQDVIDITDVQYELGDFTISSRITWEVEQVHAGSDLQRVHCASSYIAAQALGEAIHSMEKKKHELLHKAGFREWE